MQNIIPFFVLTWAFVIMPTMAQSSQQTLSPTTTEVAKQQITSTHLAIMRELVKTDSLKFNFEATPILISDVNAATKDTVGQSNAIKLLVGNEINANELQKMEQQLTKTDDVATEKIATDHHGTHKTEMKNDLLRQNAEKSKKTTEYTPTFKENTLVDRLLPTKLIDTTTNNTNAGSRLLDIWKEALKNQTAKDTIAPKSLSGSKNSVGNIHIIQDATNIIGKHKLAQPRVVQYPTKSDADVSVYKARLSALQTIVPMTYNNIVKHFIDMYVYEKRDQVNRMLTRSDMYMTLFEKSLDRHNLPAELKYLPIIESALVPHAKSEDGRSGLWQLSYATAKEYGLESNNYIDERRDPLLATEAAAMYLKNLYRRYLDWHIVIAAYNCGEAEVNKAIQKAGGVRNYWELATFLDIETQAYVPLFIAATYIMEYHNEHDFHKYEAPYNYYVTDTVYVKKAITLREIAKQVNMDINELQFLNPAIIRDVIPLSIKGYPLTLPGSKAPVFVSFLNNLSNRKEINLDRTHEASITLPRNNMLNQQPDNFGRISQSNKSENYSPQRATTKYMDEKIKSSAIVAQYKIRQGDTMQRILQMFPGVSAEDIRRINNIKGNALVNGMILKIPSGTY